MKILVIGKHGQIASALQQLAKNDIEVFAFGRDEIDIRQPLSIETKIKAIRPDIVINTAAYHVLTDCENNPQKAFELNTIAILNLAKICKQYTIKLVTFSTDYVFDGEKDTPYKELDRPNPLQIYGISKLAGEYSALCYYSEGTIIIRTNAVFGGKKGSIDKKGNFVLSILNKAKQNKLIEIGGDSRISPSYAIDVANALYSLLAKNSDSGIYHLVNEGSCTWRDFAKEVIKRASLDNQIIYKSNNETFKRPKYSVLKNTKAREMGIILPNWKDALKRYITIELHS
jgi:dTDP-4-dehydrorhamnose reductase